MTEPTKGMPLVARLQTEPDAAWEPLLAQLDEAKGRYDPVTQTSDFALREDAARTYRTSSSGGAHVYSAESDGSKDTVPDRPAKPQPQPSYRTLASGGSLRFPDDGGNKAL
jgi:hypothetical protein